MKIKESDNKLRYYVWWFSTLKQKWARNYDDFVSPYSAQDQVELYRRFAFLNKFCYRKGDFFVVSSHPDLAPCSVGPEMVSAKIKNVSSVWVVEHVQGGVPVDRAIFIDRMHALSLFNEWCNNLCLDPENPHSDEDSVYMDKNFVITKRI